MVANEPITTIRDAEETIRAYISGAPRQQALLPDERRWNMICAALDVIGDTQSAIRWYEEFKQPSELRGGAYLLIYGLLQTLYLQQDAVRHIFEALDLPFNPPDPLKRIREIRNEAVGHPTNIGRGQAVAFIVQMTVGVGGFEYHRHGTDGSLSAEMVDLIELVKLQRAAVLELLVQVCHALRGEWKEHMKKFSEVKLASLIPETWLYFVEKISQSIESQDNLTFGAFNLRYLVEAVANIEVALADRHDSADGIDLNLSELKHALGRLSDYFAGAGCSGADARVFLAFATHQLSQLEKRLEEIDAEYAEATAES